MAASPEQVDAAVRLALERVRVFFGADRGGLLAVSQDGRWARVTHEADGEGVASVSGDLNLAELFPWSAARLLVERLPSIVERFDDLPLEAAVDRDSWNRFAPMRSNLSVPIQQGVVVTHVIVLHWVHQECAVPDACVPRLRLLGEVCVNALHRREAFEVVRRSEERIARAAEAAECGLWEVDAGRGDVWLTPETRRLFDLELDEAPTFERFLRLLHPQDRDQLQAAALSVNESGGVLDQTYRILPRGGGVRWIRSVGRPSGPGRILGASVDVTDHVISEGALREHATRVAAAVDAAELGFTDWTVGEPVPFIDDRVRELLGVSPDEAAVVQQVWLARVHPEDLPRLAEERRRLIAGETAHMVCEYRFRHHERGWIWLRHSSRRLEESTGHDRKPRLIGAVQDITVARQREADLRSALEEVGRLRDQLQNENLYLREQSRQRVDPREVAGRSPAIRTALALAEQVALTNATVLLSGETGTGKERFASLIHAASPRAARAMVRVNCSAIPTALIESELFGREKGAYTGALSRQIGRFEMADGSTLFLDEVSDLPLEVQVKLLRVLQERTIERLGSPRPHAVDVRIIAATNHDLEQAVREGRFRRDLFYRLNVFPIHVPPLRDRPEDIPALVSVLLEEIGQAMGTRCDSVTKATMEALQRYAWPGNVRELRNVLERAMILASGPVLHIDMPSGATPAPVTTAPGSPDGRLEDVERDHIVGVLRKTGWRIKGQGSASVLLGMKPSTLYSRMKKLGIARPQ